MADGTPRDGRPLVVITRKLPDEVERALARHCDVRPNPDDTPFGRREWHAALTSADAVVCTVTDRVTAEVLAAQPLRARLLANFGVGFNHIDLDAARSRGIAVSNTPEVLTDATADLAMLLLLGVARRAGAGERELRAGRWTGWRPTHLLGTHVSGKVLGLVGMGRIARAVARRAGAGFGMRVIYYTPRPLPAEVVPALGAEPKARLDEVLAAADFVSLHCPATPETRHLIGAAQLDRMKPTAFLINTARGDVVDERALIQALRAGRIAGAGLDVYEHEPAVSPALLALDNVMLLPHLGSATAETRSAMGLRVLENLRSFFRDGTVPDRIV